MKRWGALIFLLATTGAAFAQTRIASSFGEANVGNRKVIVHVTVAVPPGLEAKAVGDDAVRAQGARPLEPAELTLNGLHWPTSSPNLGPIVVQAYNSAGEPLAGAGSELAAAQNTWSTVTSSTFQFYPGAATTRCPSLVRECPGPQVFDGHNDVGWIAISGCCTLGVTWYSTSGTAEADMALNTRFAWNNTGAAGGYDLQTVYLHEDGHVVGLGHSTVSGSVMEATYAGVRRALMLDDITGITYLYPRAGYTGDISGTVAGSSGPLTGAQVTLSPLPVSATTDSTGSYLLGGIPILTGLSYTVTAGASGYQSKSVTGVVPPATVNFTLTPATPAPCRGKKCQ